MKRFCGNIRRIAIAISLVFSLSLLNYSLNVLNVLAARGKGGQPGAFLSWGAGARSLGMGKAFVALADDATATYWNPAGLAKVQRRETSFLHAMLWEGTMYDFLSYAHPLTDIGTLGINITRLYLGGFEGRDEFNRMTHAFKDVQSAYSVCLGKQVSEDVSLGASLKSLSHTLDSHKSGSFTMDTGIIYRPPVEHLQLGLNLQNLIEFKTGDETSDKLPLRLRLGGAYRLLKERLALSMDIEKSGVPGFDYHLGTEYWALNYLALRMGMDAEEFTMGFGVRYRDYGIDYAFAMHDLGASHRISASMQFGPSIEMARKGKAEEFYQKGMALYDRGMYSRAVGNLAKAWSFSPEDLGIKNTLTKLEKVIKIVREETGRGRESDLIRKSVAFYLDGDLKNALNISRYILSLHPEDEVIQNFVKFLREEAGISEEEFMEDMESGMTLVDYKLYKALNYFYEGRYDQVLKEAQDILVIEPDNALAFKRIGSAYYAMGQRQRAIEAWERSLELRPDDKSLRVFLRKLEKEKGMPIDRELEFLQDLQKKGNK